MSKFPSESQIKSAILETFGCRDDMRIFNNPVGNTPTDYGGRVRFGLAVGSSDLIGWIVRNGVAVFLALEVKDHRGKPTQAQQDFIALVNSMGGIAGVVRSVEDVHYLINGLNWIPAPTPYVPVVPG